MDLLARTPDHPTACFNLALLRRAEGKLAEAAALLAALPFREARVQLAVVERQRGRLVEAGAAYRSLIEADAADAEGWAGLGSVLAMAGDGAARAALGRALALTPAAAAWWADLGHLDRTARPDQAAVAYARALVLDPADAIVAHHLAALSGAAVSHAPNDYVAGLFDAYAERFDAELVGKLGYRVPDEIARLVAALGTDLDIADLGCGTGLCAPGLKPHARRLVGVDLSAAMLAQADRLGLYDELVKADLGAFLEGRPGAFDLAVAGDVFVYVGALESVFSSLGRAVRPGGHVAFSVEQDEGAGVALRPSGRFAHGAAHVAAAAENAGFTLVARHEVVLRQDHGRPIQGCLYLYARTGGQLPV
jgi:predicted TPR repeat methyltransferase